MSKLNIVVRLQKAHFKLWIVVAFVVAFTFVYQGAYAEMWQITAPNRPVAVPNVYNGSPSLSTPHFQMPSFSINNMNNFRPLFITPWSVAPSASSVRRAPDVTKFDFTNDGYNAQETALSYNQFQQIQSQSQQIQNIAPLRQTPTIDFGAVRHGASTGLGALDSNTRSTDFSTYKQLQLKSVSDYSTMDLERRLSAPQD